MRGCNARLALVVANAFPAILLSTKSRIGTPLADVVTGRWTKSPTDAVVR